MRTLMLTPDGVRFSADFGRGVLGNQDQVPALKVNRRYVKEAQQVHLEWAVVGIEYDYMMAFYRRAMKKGVLPFVLELPIRDGTLQTYKANIVPDSWNTQARGPLLFSISATAMVMPYAAP